MTRKEMVKLLRKEYWNRADAFLLPLTGLRRDDKFSPKSFLFWNDNTIYDYKLTLSYDNSDSEAFLMYARKHIFPTLDRNNYLLENYDVRDRTIFVLDLSDWADDIKHFLAGRYSRLSPKAKQMIENYHTFEKNNIPIHIFTVLYPNTRFPELGNMTPIEYVCQPDTYGLDYDVMKSIGEIGSVFSEKTESLLTLE